MTPRALLSTLHAAGVVLTLDAGALHYKVPKGVMTPDLLEAFEERTAIMEYCGRGLSREESERLAWVCVLGEPQP